MRTESLSPSRLEAFSDGVIAVIITVMVLELKVPLTDGFAGLHSVLPTIGLYGLSFVQVGIYWVNHHYLIDEADSVSHATLWANLAFLFFLSLFPFATAWLGEKHMSPFATAVYSAVSLLPGVFYALLWLTIRKRSSVPPHASWAKMISSVVLYVVAVPAALLRPSLALGLLCTVALMWVIPPRHDDEEHGSPQAASSSSATSTSHKR